MLCSAPLLNQQSLARTLRNRLFGAIIHTSIFEVKVSPAIVRLEYTWSFSI